MTRALKLSTKGAHEVVRRNRRTKTSQTVPVPTATAILQGTFTAREIRNQPSSKN